MPAETVEAIITAVRSARRGKRFPKQPNPHRLRRSINWAGVAYASFTDIGPKQPWGERREHGEELLRWAARGQKLLTPLLTRNERTGQWADDAGGWWARQLCRHRTLPGSTLHATPFPNAVLMHEFEERVTQVFEITPTLENDGPLSRRRGGRKRQESSLDWLIGKRLVRLFKQEFGLKAKVNQSQSTKTGKYTITNSPYVAFARSVLGDLGITNRDGSPISDSTIYRAVKQMAQKRER